MPAKIWQDLETIYPDSSSISLLKSWNSKKIILPAKGEKIKFDLVKLLQTNPVICIAKYYVNFYKPKQQSDKYTHTLHMYRVLDYTKVNRNYLCIA